MLSEQDTNTGDLNVISLKKYLDMETNKSDEAEPNDLVRAALEYPAGHGKKRATRLSGNRFRFAARPRGS